MIKIQNKYTSNLNNTKDVLLINPPFGPANSPYIAIPVLASYLKSKSIMVDAFDLNREFFCRLYEPQRIVEGFNYCVNRVCELNSKSQLDFQSAIELRYLTLLLSKFPLYENDIIILSSSFIDFEDIRDLKSQKLYAAFSTFKNFPQFIFTSPLSLAMADYDSFSSSDIIKNFNKSDYYTNTFREIIGNELKDRLPKCVGFSVAFTQQIVPAFQCAKIIKDMAPETHITLGGPCISIFFRETMIDSFFNVVDSFVMDAGEIPLELLIKELKKEKPDFNKVPGLVYLNNGLICKNPSAKSIDMEKVPPPDYTVFQLDKYLDSIENMIITFPLSRGCYWKRCSFCRTGLDMTCDYQQPDKKIIYKHFLHVMEQTKAKNFFFSDEAASPETLEYISENLLKDKIKINWKAHGKISSQLTNQRCQLFKKAGCTQFYLGIESFSDRILKLMNKGITVSKIEKVLKEINGLIPAGAYMIVGFPSETEEEAIEGFKRIKNYCKTGLLASYYYSVFSIFYGSDIWNRPGEYGIFDIEKQTEQDLLADRFIFKSNGMERAKVFELYRNFRGINKMIDQVLTCKELKVWDKFIPLRYDLKNIVEAEKQNLCISEFSYVKWLDITNKKIPPFKQKTFDV